MRRQLGRRPSPAMAIAVAAMVVAVAGSAFAGVAGVSSLSKKEKRKVSKIADRRIDAKAPGLSVKSAGNVTNQEWAVVSAAGALVRSTSGITGVSHDPSLPGRYQVIANRDLNGCYFLATLGGDTPNAGLRGDISVNQVAGTSDQVYVLTSSEGAGTNADRAFTLLIRCG